MTLFFKHRVLHEFHQGVESIDEDSTETVESCHPEGFEFRFVFDNQCDGDRHVEEGGESAKNGFGQSPGERVKFFANVRYVKDEENP